MKIAIVKNDNYNVLSVYDAAAPSQASYGGDFGRATYCTHIAIPVNMHPEVISARDDGDGGIELYIDEDKELIKNQGDWTRLRAERNRRLTECDWTQLPDSPLTQEERTSWCVYRQALRDLPGQVGDPAGEIDWPETP